MSDSIFEFGDKFGIKSPFGNWLKPLIEFKEVKYEIVYVENQDKTISTNIVFSFSVNSNISDSQAKTTLRTNESSNPLQLPEKGKLTPLKTGNNEFQISLNLSSYENRLKKAGSIPIKFFLTLVSSDQTIKSEEITLQSFSFKVNETSEDELHKIIHFEIDSVGMLTQKIEIQAYQKTDSGNQLIVGLKKTIYIDQTFYTNTFKISKSTLAERLKLNKNEIYVLEATFSANITKSIEVDLKNLTQKEIISAAQIQKIIPSTGLEKIKSFVRGINQALIDNKITSNLQIAHFLAQIFHESAGLNSTKEYGVSEDDYDGFYGRGLIQITTKENYKKYEAFCGEDVTSTKANRDKLILPFHAAKSAGWWWSLDTYNELAEANDFIMITRKVNGGFNGYDERLKLFNLAYNVLSSNSINVISFKESKAYNESRASFAWGLWHDPGIIESQFNTCSNDKKKAIEGYERFLSLDSNASTKFGWYRINSLAVFSTIKQEYTENGKKKTGVNVKKAAELRLKALKI